MKAKFLMIVVAACAAAGCGPDVTQSKAAYIDCMRQNGAEPRRCTGLRETYEANSYNNRVPNGPMPDAGSMPEPVVSP